jgi:hypothetical protein
MDIVTFVPHNGAPPDNKNEGRPPETTLAHYPGGDPKNVDNGSLETRKIEST